MSSRRWLTVFSVCSVLWFSACSSDEPNQKVQSGPSYLVQIMGSDTVLVGGCNQVQLQAVDKDGVATKTDLGAAFNILASGNAKVYSDNACTAQVTAIPASATGNAAFYIKGTQSESLGLSVSIFVNGNIASGSRSITLRPLDADHLALVVSSSSATTSCVPVLVRSLDLFNNPSPFHNNLLVSLSGAGLAQTSVFGDSQCLTPTTVTSLNSGIDTSTVYVQALQIGTYQLTATTGGLTAATANMGFIAVSSPRLVFVVPSGNNVVGSCVPVRAESQRANGTSLLMVGASLPFTASVVTGTGVNLFSDVNCGIAVAAPLAIADGTYSTTFFAKTTQAPQVSSLSGNATGFVSASASLNWVPVPATQLQISGTPASMQAGGCAVGQVSLLDANGNPTFAPSSVSVALSRGLNLTQTDVFASNNCSGATVSSVTIPVCAVLGACSSSVSFSFLPKKVGGLSITASASGLNASSVSVSVLNPSGTPNKLVLTRLTETVLAGTCVGFTVESKDAFDNLLNVSPTDLVLTTTSTSASGLGSFYTDSNCVLPQNGVTILNGTSSSTVYYKNPKAENVVVTIAKTPTYLAQNSFGVATNVPAKLVFNGVPSTMSAGRCSGGFFVQQKDAFDNLTNKPVNFNLLATNGVSFYGDASCSSSVNVGSIPNGASQSGTFYFAGNATGSSTLTATATSPNTITQAAAALVTMTALSPLHVSIQCFGGTCSSFAAGSCQGLEATLMDDTNVAFVPVNTSVTALMTSTSATAQTFYSDSACSIQLTQNKITFSSSANPQAVFTKNSVAETYSVTATPSVGVAGSVALSTKAAAPHKLMITSGPAAITSETCSGPYTIETEDSFGNDAVMPSSQQVYFNTSTLNGSAMASNPFYGDAACTSSTVIFASGGASAQFYVKSVPAGAMVAKVATVITSQNGSYNVSITERAKPVFLVNGSTISGINFNSVQFNTASTITATLKNATAGESAVFSNLAVSALPFKILSTTSPCSTTQAFTLVAGASCNMVIEFKPTQANSYSETLNATYTSASNSTATTKSVSLSGTGTPPPNAQVVLDVASINFQSIKQGESSSVVTVTVRNQGGQDADTISFDNFSAPFLMTLNNCGGTLTSGSSCTIAFKFSPTAAGSFSAAMKLHYRNVVSNTTTNVDNALSLSGTGLGLEPAYITLGYGGINFGNVPKNYQAYTSVLVTNDGEVAATNVGFLKSLNFNAYGFKVESQTCQSTINPGTSCWIKVTFTPNYNGTVSGAFAMTYSSGSSNYQTGDFSVSGYGYGF